MARKAAISFGLVHIPVKYENATQDNDIRFNQLHKKCGQRIKYSKSCPACGIDNVPAEDIVKGYEYETDKYVIIEDDEFESIKTEKDRRIEIIQFADISEIDPVFYNKSYYLFPDGSDKAFNLLKTAIEKENRVAIAKTVLSTKESLVGIRVKNNALILNTMFFADEIRPAPQSVLNTDIHENELEMAVSLIQGMTRPFKAEEYKNEYQERLKALISDKIQGNDYVKQKSIEQDNVLNLVEALQASLQTVADQQAPKPKGRKKKVSEQV